MKLIKKTLLITFALFAISILKADTYYTEKTKCPHCKKKFKVTLMGSYSTFGSYKDFQKYGAIGTYYELSIKRCPRCNFSGYYSEFKKPRKFSNDLKDSVQLILDNYKNRKITESVECEIAADLYELYGSSNDYMANIYLIASYILKFDKEQTDLRKAYQEKTIKYLMNALEDKEYEKPETYAVINYLIGELYRRIGNFDKSLEFFDKAVNNEFKPEWVIEIVSEQLKLSKAEDDNNEI